MYKRQEYALAKDSVVLLEQLRTIDKKRLNRTLKLAKGYRGARSKQYRVAKQSVMKMCIRDRYGRA